MSLDRDYFGIAQKYAADVVSGKIDRCIYVRQACQRHIDDLERENFPYRFEIARGARVCAFVERLPHVKGRWKGNLMLEPFQVFDIMSVFSWVDEDGNRRFRKVYKEIPRKNGKSTETAAIGLYMLTLDGEPGAEIYSAATTREQAKIVFQSGAAMVRKRSADFAQINFKATTHAIVATDGSESFFRALSRDSGGNQDGLNPHAALIDELHAHKSRAMVDVLESADGARTQALMWMITTAGSNNTGVCYEYRSYTVGVLNGSIQDDSFYGIIYTIDDGDDPFVESSWKKANPNYGGSIIPETIARAANAAQQQAGKQNNFLTKRLNVWVNAEAAWLTTGEWKACGNNELQIEDCEGWEAHGAVDLASVRDIASFGVIFKNPDTGKRHAFVKNYVNSDCVEETDNVFYAQWVKDGRLIVTEGSTTDIDQIESDVIDLCKQHSIRSIAFDPWQSNQFASHIEDSDEIDVEVVEFRQVTKYLSPAMKHLERWIINQEIEHEDCPVLNWMMSNVVCRSDANDNIFPRKEKAENKIDGALTLIMCAGRWEIDDEEGGSIYDDIVV